MYLELGLLLVIVSLLIRLQIVKKRTKKLFYRAWSLELRLMHIYEKADDTLKVEIEKILKEIKPLK